jgi:ankyrin repeat protein
VDTVKGLLQKGANPNTSDEFKRTPLMIASLNGKADVVETLIKAGAEISAKAQFGQTALQFAIEGGHAGIVEMLKAAQGVNPPSPSPP